LKFSDKYLIFITEAFASVYFFIETYLKKDVYDIHIMKGGVEDERIS